MWPRDKQRHGMEIGVYFTSSEKTLDDPIKKGDISLAALRDWRETRLEI